MQGIEISKKYFEEYGHDLLSKFDDLADRIAVGIAGAGSECLGFDDIYSHDHDFHAGFSMWLTDEDFEKYGEKLNVEYQKLPKEFLGIKLQNRGQFSIDKFGASTISSFFQNTIGFPTVPTAWQRWFYVSPQNFLEATNGEIFLDNLGVFTEIRRQLTCNFPTDVRLKKLSAHLCLMSQSGQYNYSRMAKHGGAICGEMALSEFINHTFQVSFLLSEKFAPYYKWQLKTLSAMPEMSCFYANITKLLTTSCCEDNIAIKANIIEEICTEIVKILSENSLSTTCSDYLENHGLEILASIKNIEIKAMHSMDFGA